jgi:hypothetical protein
MSLKIKDSAVPIEQDCLRAAYRIHRKMVMVTPVIERIRKLRESREGRTLSVWLYGEEARMFENIRILTNDTNDAIIKDAIQDLYEKIFSDKCSKIIADRLKKEMNRLGRK